VGPRRGTRRLEKEHQRGVSNVSRRTNMPWGQRSEGGRQAGNSYSSDLIQTRKRLGKQVWRRREQNKRGEAQKKKYRFLPFQVSIGKKTPIARTTSTQRITRRRDGVGGGASESEGKETGLFSSKLQEAKIVDLYQRSEGEGQLID